ncbi:MAG: transglutaminase domain-containing protein [Sedimentibacter sp.]
MKAKTSIKLIIMVILSIISFGQVQASASTEADAIITPIIKASEIQIVKNPTTVEDFEKILLFMNYTNTYELDIPYTFTIQEGMINNTYDALTNMFDRYPEFMSFSYDLDYSIDNDNLEFKVLTLKLSSPNFTEEEVIDMKTKFFDETENIVHNLIEEGKITSNMTDKEKAQVFFEWIVLNASYDYSYAPESFTGYGQFYNQKVVCQGYTSIFNSMLKMVGIKEVEGIPGFAKYNNGPHIWTRANIDGEKVYFDVTWGDNEDSCDYSYFATDADFMSTTHSWDVDKLGY